MGVKIKTREYENSFRPEIVDWLIGGILEWKKLKLGVEFSIEKKFSNSSLLLLQGNDVITSDGTDWSSYGFDLGDTIVFDFITHPSGSSATPSSVSKTVTSIQGDTMTIDTPLISAIPNLPYEDSTVKYYDVSVYSDKRPEGVEITYGHITNSNYASSSLISLIDGTESKLNALNLDSTTSGTLNSIGIQSGMSLENGSWDYVGKNGTHTYEFNFTFEFMISSFFESISDIENLTPPTAFFNGESLTDNFKIIGFPEWNNPNTRIQNDLSKTKRLGNTGWANENFNGLQNNFTVESLEYTDVATSTIVSELSYSDETKVKAVISGVNNLIDGSTNCGFSFVWLPEDEDLYKNKNTPIHKNLLMNTGGGFENDDFLVSPTAYSGPYDGFTNDSNIKMDVKDVKFSIDSGNLVFEGIFSPTIGFKNKMDALDESERNYALFVSVADHTLVTNFSDRVPLLLDFNKMDLYIEPVGAWDPMSIVFYEHQNDGTEGGEPCALDMFVEDDILAKLDFKVDINGVIPNAIEFAVEMENTSTGEVLNLQSYKVDLSGYPNDSNGVPQWNYNQSRGFKLGNGNSKNWVKVERNASNDAGDEKGYTAFFGLKIRWEDWIEELGVPGDFFNAGESFNGFNNDWFQYLGTLGWEYKFASYLDAEINGESVRYKNERLQSFRDYDSSVEISTEWNFYRDSDNALLNAGLDAATGKPLGVILENEQVRVEIIYTRANGIWDDVDDVYSTTCIEVDKGSGQFEFRQISSIWGSETDNPLVPLSGESLLKLTLVSPTVIKSECLIEPSFLNDALKYKCSGRIGCKLPIPPQFEASIETTFIGGTTGLWDFDFEFSEKDGADLSGETVFFQVIDCSTATVIADVEYLYGESPGVIAPQVDNVGNWVSDVQQYIQPTTQFIDGGNGGFTKLIWAVDTDKIDDLHLNNSTELFVRIKISNSNWNNDIMNVKNRLGKNFGIQTKYDPIREIFLNTDSALRDFYILDSNLNLSTRLFNQTNVYNRYLVTDFDLNELVNGYPKIYGLLPQSTYPNYNLVSFEFDGIKDWNMTTLTGTFTGFLPGNIRRYSDVNGKPSFFSSNLTHHPSRPVLFQLTFWDGVDWVNQNFTSLIPSSSFPPSNPGYQMKDFIFDNQGRIYYVRTRSFGTASIRHSFVGRLTYSGTGNIQDVANWTNKVIAGSISTNGDIDGLGTLARFSTGLQGVVVNGYDNNNEPILYVNDRNNGKIKKLIHDLTTDTYESNEFKQIPGVTGMVIVNQEIYYNNNSTEWNKIDDNGNVSFVQNMESSDVKGIKY